jgi:hypothetical protein
MNMIAYAIGLFVLSQSKGRHYNAIGNPGTLYVLTRHRWKATYGDLDHIIFQKKLFCHKGGEDKDSL